MKKLLLYQICIASACAVPVANLSSMSPAVASTDNFADKIYTIDEALHYLDAGAQYFLSNFLYIPLSKAQNQTELMEAYSTFKKISAKPITDYYTLKLAQAYWRKFQLPADNPIEIDIRNQIKENIQDIEKNFHTSANALLGQVEATSKSTPTTTRINQKMIVPTPSLKPVVEDFINKTYTISEAKRYLNETFSYFYTKPLDFALSKATSPMPLHKIIESSKNLKMQLDLIGPVSRYYCAQLVKAYVSTLFHNESSVVNTNKLYEEISTAQKDLENLGEDVESFLSGFEMQYRNRSYAK